MFVVDFQMCCKMLFQSVRKRKFKHRSKKYNTTTKEDENAYKLRGSIVDSKGKDQWCYHKKTRITPNPDKDCLREICVPLELNLSFPSILSLGNRAGTSPNHNWEAGFWLS